MSSSRLPNEVQLPTRAIGRADAIFFGITFVFIYSQLFQFPFIPYYFEGDHIIVTSNAMRLLNGEVIYRDFFHLASPGAEVVYAALFSVFGIKVWVLNAVIMLLGLAMAGFTWYFSRQLFTGLLVYLPASLLLIIGFRLFYIDGSYRLFSVIFVLGAVAVLFNHLSPRNLIFAGILCGLSSFFMQPRGLVGIAAILLFVTWSNYKKGFQLKSLIQGGLCLLLPFALVLILTQAYFVYEAGFENYYFSIVTFVQKHYPNDPLARRTAFLTDFPSLRQFLGIYSTWFALSRYFRIVLPILFFYLLVPAVYIVFLLAKWKRPSYIPEEHENKLVLLCFVGMGLFAGVSVLSAIRLSHIAVPAVILFVWMLHRLPCRHYVVSSCLVILGIIGVLYTVQRQTIAKSYLDLPAGSSAFLSEQVYARYKWIGDHTNPGDRFYEGHHPSFYFPFHLINPTPMYLVRDSEYTPSFQVDGVVRSLRDNPPNFIAWPRKWIKPGEERVRGDNLEPLWQFIATNYELEVEFTKPLDYNEYSEGDIEIWRRKDALP